MQHNQRAYSQRAIERMDGLIQWLVSFTGERVSPVREIPPLIKWQIYELLREGVKPDAIGFYLRLNYPNHLSNPVVNGILSSALHEAYKDHIDSLRNSETRRVKD